MCHGDYFTKQPGVTGSTRGLVGAVSECCDRARQEDSSSDLSFRCPLSVCGALSSEKKQKQSRCPLLHCVMASKEDYQAMCAVTFNSLCRWQLQIKFRVHHEHSAVCCYFRGGEEAVRRLSALTSAVKLSVLRGCSQAKTKTAS